MVKVKVIEDFSLKDFASLQNLKRANEAKDKQGSLFGGDIFECDEKMVDYLTGNNPLNKKVVEIIEVVEEKKEEEHSAEAIEKTIEEKPKKKKNKKSKN